MRHVGFVGFVANLWLWLARPARDNKGEYGMLEWDDARHGLGVEGMDATHREFVDMVMALAKADDGGFPTLFQQLVEHTRQHFAEEGRLMRLCGFPPIAIHEGEHARVLEVLDRVGQIVQQGDLAQARAFVNADLGEWFPRHLATMDRALAMHLMRTGHADAAGGVLGASPL